MHSISGSEEVSSHRRSWSSHRPSSRYLISVSGVGRLFNQGFFFQSQQTEVTEPLIISAKPLPRAVLTRPSLTVPNPIRPFSVARYPRSPTDVTNPFPTVLSPRRIQPSRQVQFQPRAQTMWSFPTVMGPPPPTPVDPALLRPFPTDLGPLHLSPTVPNLPRLFLMVPDQLRLSPMVPDPLHLFPTILGIL